MTTREHLEFYGRAKGVLSINRDVDLIMRKIGLKAFENCHASKLSGGNKRKLSLAIALIGKLTLTYVCKLLLISQEIHRLFSLMNLLHLWMLCLSALCGRLWLKSQLIARYL